MISGFTAWEPRIDVKQSEAPGSIVVEGVDHLESIAKMNLALLRNRWSDGLPVVPATRPRVDAILNGTDLARDMVVGRILPRGGVATVESLAINLAMAGGRPEYLPVLIAAMRGLTDPSMRQQMMQSTTGSVCPVVIVNGPVARQIRLNSGYGCLGPDPAHPAGGSIGRAIRLVLQNVGGAVPGAGNMSIYGGPSRYANFVFAEDVAGLPPDWEPLHVERGFPAASNVATVYAVASTAQLNSPKVSTEKVALPSLDRIARVMAADYGNVFSSCNDAKVPGIVLLPRGIARGLSGLGWSKRRVKAYLWEHSKIPWSVVRGDYYLYIRKADAWPLLADGEPWPLAPRADNIMIVVAGGEQSQHGYWMRVGCCPFAPASSQIELPANWDRLLEHASEELGPLPAT
ncbi:MAG: hypothetical protein HYY32_02000 [Chloroflexi bacterium]|nr:hypothetical protein [Chloroflexota bacterium]